jgi:hypothetical protein
MFETVMDCPICRPCARDSVPAADLSGVDVFQCPTHGTFGVLRSRRGVFDQLAEAEKLAAVDTAKSRNMTMGYPVIDAFSI